MTGIGRSETCVLTVFVLRFLDPVCCPAPKGSLYFVLNQGVGLLQADAPCNASGKIKQPTACNQCSFRLPRLLALRALCLQRRYLAVGDAN